MIPKFDSYSERSGAQLQCPGCGEITLHHDKVDVFERGEDEKNGVHVLVSNGKAEFDIALDGNPSDRRNGLTVRFWCESCDAKPVLSISQHKGLTLVDFK